MAEKATTTSEKPPYESTPEDRRRGLWLGFFYLALASVLAYMLFIIWPPVPWPDPDEHPETIAQAFRECGYAPPEPRPTPAPGETAAARESEPVAMPIRFLGMCRRTTFDERLLLLVIVAGMLGSFVHGATSLADYLGNNRFGRRWTWFYLLRPVIGMALALVFYFVIRGGFLTTNVGATDINPYGIAALAGLVGMFSKQATDKLSEVFSTLFRSGEGDQKRADPLDPTAAPALTVVPDHAIAGGETFKLTVNGTGFVDGCKIVLDDIEQPTTTFESATTLSVQVAEEAIATARTIKLSVIRPDQTKYPAIDFRVIAAENGGGADDSAKTELATITGFDPPSVNSGSAGQVVKVIGANFADSDTIHVNNEPQTTTFVSPTELIVELNTSQFASQGNLKFKVVNQAGASSTETDFTVT